MKKSYKMENLDCANCAAKMEAKIKKISGVDDANISFMLQKLTIEGDGDKWDDIMSEAAKVCKKVESDCIIKM
ncbi:MAG: cation transporter [Bacillota bacterium]|nr:cation transporter [Bacillota bacterium]